MKSPTPPPREPPRRGWLLFVLGGAVLLLILLGRRGSDPGRTSSPKSSEEPAPHGLVRGQTRGEGPTPSSSAPRGDASSSGEGGARGDEAPAAANADAESEAQRRERSKTRRLSMVADAMELNRFPPDSRPLTREMTDMMRPYSRHEYPMPIRRKLGKGERLDEEQAPFYLLTGPRYLLTRGDPLEARLEVYRGNPAGKEAPEKIAVEIVASQLFRFGQPQYTPLGKVLMNDDGAHGDERGGDLTYGVSVNPGDLKELAGYNGLLQLVVDFRVGSIEYIVRATLDFMLTAQEPARYSGVFSEKITPQGLEITAQVEVIQGGLYFLQGLLFDAKNNPIGFSVARPTWEPGKHGVTFSFFGLLFHEAQAEGPYVLRTLTGARLPADGEPFKVEMPPFPGEYRTRAYRLSEFSGSEYESAQKDKHIQDLQELADKNPDKTPAPADSQPSAPADPPAPASSAKK